ncbi:MAG: hypothetical protein NT036_04525 [Candidatus Omnitrophica bacterium]|nr:hypothetical protein [Candidatus Omnitrophota bacterium]
MRWVAIVLVVLLCGCSATQVRQEFLGYSMNDVKNSRNKQMRDFDMSSTDCIAKIKDVLQDMQAIAREDETNQYIVADNFQGVFRSTIDTTQVGILVTSVSDNRCRVEVASENIDLAAFVANEIAIKERPKKGILFKTKKIM